jgi:dipeptidyl aminopeptidase/acylaminoacyl peptidase
MQRREPIIDLTSWRAWPHLLVLALWAAAGMARAADPGPLTIDEAFRAGGIGNMRISPDGRHLVAIGYVKGASAVMLVDAETSASKIIIGPASGADAPYSASWITDELLAVNTLQTGSVVDLAGQRVRDLRTPVARVVRPDAQGHERVLALGRKSMYHIERIDVRTGLRTLLNFDIPGDPVKWVLDDDGAPLVVTTRDSSRWSDQATVTHWHRRSIEDKWQALATFPVTAVPWTPMYLMQGGQSLAVLSTEGRDTRAAFRYDLQERRMTELLAGHPTEDIDSVARSDDDAYVRVSTKGMKEKIHWFDARWSALQRAVDDALPDRINWLSGDNRGRVLVASSSDVDPGEWFLLDTATMSLKKIAAAKPWIDPARMLPKRIVQYTSSDGLAIPAYLTLPRGASQPVAAIIRIHGGPWARDEWNWDPEVQLLAARGYAVLQPQFRGSLGFGQRFAQAGIGQWGLAMQDDVTAGANWLVAQGIADAARLCIVGGSYGGYAALWGLVKTPRLFRCGVSFAGVSDLNLMFKDDSDVNDSVAASLQTRAWVGDPKTMRQQFDDVSPLRHAAEIQVPVLIAHGDRDARVPIEHSEKMVDALRAHHKDVTWLELKDEGHGIRHPENRKRYYEALFDFLDRNIGPGSPASRAAVVKTE